MSERSQNKQVFLPTTLSVTGPSQILPFLYVGSQEDAISSQIVQDIHITHVINVSTTGDRAPFLNENDDEHFLRIPVNDCLNAQLLPYFDKIYTFIEKARLSNGRVLIHCLAGISRSPAVAIAYIMRYLHLSADDAYKYVKQRRSQISPNFNFLGQLSEYERNQSLSFSATSSTTSPIVKCIANETPFNDRRRFVQVEGHANTNVLTRPTTLLSSSSPSTSLSLPIGITPEQKILSKPKLLRPTNISLKSPSLELMNSSNETSKDKKQTETKPKSADISSSSNEKPDLINTFFQGSPISKSTDEWTSAQSHDSSSEKTKTNVIKSSLEVLVL